MKILMIAHGFPPECSGGTEFYVLRLGKELRARGYGVSVFTGSHAAAPPGVWTPIMDEVQHEGIDVFRVHRTGLYVDNYERSLAPEVNDCLRNVLKKVKPDIVHIHHWIRLSRTLVQTCHEQGVSAVCTLHDLWTTCPMAFRVRDSELCERPQCGDSCVGCATAHTYMDEEEQHEELDLFHDDLHNELKMARRLIVPSNAHRDALLKHHSDLQGRFRVVPHGNISAIAPNSGKKGSFPKEKPLRIAHWGHLTTLKGVDVLLQAIKALDPDQHPVHLDLYGDIVYPQEKEAIEELAEDLSITWHGAFSPLDLKETPMDLAVIPSRCSESWSFVLDEALLLGVPVFASDRGALTERIHGTGATFDPDDPSTLTALIKNVFEDPDRLAGYRSTRRELPTLQEHTDGIVAVYREVLTSQAKLPTTSLELRERRIRIRCQQLERRFRSLMQGEGLAKYHRRRIAELETELQENTERLAEARANLERIHEFRQVAEDREKALAELRQTLRQRLIENKKLQELALSHENQIARLRQQQNALEASTGDLAKSDPLANRIERMGRYLLDLKQVQVRFGHLAQDLPTDQIPQLLKDEHHIDNLAGELQSLLSQLSDYQGLTHAKEAQIRTLHGDLAQARNKAVEAREARNKISVENAMLQARARATETEAANFKETLANRDKVIEDIAGSTNLLLDLIEEKERRQPGDRLPRRTDSSRLRILMVVHQFLPQHVAGTELYTHALSKQLSKSHEVRILTAESNHSEERFTEHELLVDGLNVHQVIHNYKWDNFKDTYDSPRMDAIFRRIIRSMQPDIIHIQHLHYGSANYITIAHQMGIPVVYTLHDYMLMCPKDGTLRRDDGDLCQGPVAHRCADCLKGQDVATLPPLLPRALHPGMEALLPNDAAETVRRFRLDANPATSPEEMAAATRLDYLKRVLKDVSLFISPSQFLKDRFVASGMIGRERILVSDNGYDLNRLPQARGREKSADLRVGFVGTLAEHKGAHLLVAAMNLLKGKPIACNIWGEVKHFPHYVDRLRKLNENPQTAILGSFQPHRAAEVFAKMDLLVVPSLWFENSPLTIHEAAAARVPVLVSDHGGLSEYVRQETTGRTFRPGDAKDLARMILTFKERPLSVREGALKIKDIQSDAEEMGRRYRSVLKRQQVHHP